MPAVLPPPVRPGARVGVAALSSHVDTEKLARGLAALRELGFEPVPARNLDARWGFFAGRDEERLEAFHELIADPTLEAVLFARGGHGILRLLDRLDWELVGRTPRAWVGYSDLTPFLLEVVRRFGLVTFHGPMVATDLARGLGGEEASSLLGALAGEPLRYELPDVLRGGVAEGPLLGGCLSLLVATLGTPFAPRLDGSVLFVEDVDEPPYRIDRMLTHLRLSGSLRGVQGLAAGYLGEAWGARIAASWLEEPLATIAGPVAFGLAAGHDVPNLTLPLGRAARLDADAGRLEIG